MKEQTYECNTQINCLDENNKIASKEKYQVIFNSHDLVTQEGKTKCLKCGLKLGRIDSEKEEIEERKKEIEKKEKE